MNMNWGECYYDHFVRFLGQPVAREIFRQDDNHPSIQILSYDRVFQGCRIFCSFGLSQFSSKTGGIAEVCLPIDDGWDDAAYVLANALFFMTKNQIKMGWGVSIGGIEQISPQFVSKFNKSVIYFTNIFALPDDFGNVSCGTKTGKVYLAMFISQSEHHFFKQHGAEAFETLLEDKQVDPFALHRVSII